MLTEDGKGSRQGVVETHFTVEKGGGLLDTSPTNQVQLKRGECLLICPVSGYRRDGVACTHTRTSSHSVKEKLFQECCMSCMVDFFSEAEPGSSTPKMRPCVYLSGVGAGCL